jgi:hypothetical protein
MRTVEVYGDRHKPPMWAIHLSDDGHLVVTGENQDAKREMLDAWRANAESKLGKPLSDAEFLDTLDGQCVSQRIFREKK